ncbi:MAG: diguanylate cyclase [Lachnospiraceae bacterium]|nr:diguanylate cyclase [Lachnospiraceae bacterium]
MKQEQMKNLKVFAITLAMLLLGFYAFFRILAYKYVSPTNYELIDNWDITVNGTTYHNVSLNEFEFRNLKRGDVISLSNTIPERVVGNQTMMFNTYLSSVNVILGDVSIYQYAMKRDEADDIIGSGCHFVIIPRNSSGKTFHINLTARENNAFTNMETITFVPTTHAYSYYTLKKASTIFISFFLVILGIILSIVGAIILFSNSHNFQLTYIGLFSFFMGMWSMCNVKVLQIFNINLSSCASVEYLSLFASTIPLTMLLSAVRKDYTPRSRLAMRGIALVFTIFVVITSFLHFTKIVHYSQVLSIFHMLVGMSLLVFAIVNLRNHRKKTTAEIAMSLGFIVLCLSFAADLIRFNVQKYLMPNNPKLYDSFIPIGTLIFIILLLYSFSQSTLTMIHDKAEQELLSYIAYHDDLCKIYNRAMCDKEFERLDTSDENYSLVNLDLNGLKAINDRMGHAAGDKLLVSFANILTKAFENIGTCYRMGGDEFIVIVPESGTPFISNCIERMEILEKEGSKELDYPIEASYGIASRNEVPECTAAKVNSLADSRMYEMKVLAHKNRK